MHGISEFVQRDTLLDEKNGLLPNDTLTILCHVAVNADTVVTTGDQTPIDVPECHLINDFGQLLHNADCSDCTLVAGRKEFKVHKAVLAARSPVFAAMFRHGMLEAQKDRIDVPDIVSDAMHQLLQFIYTGTAPNLHEFSPDLLAAADKYQLDRLKALCEKAIHGSITPDNACEMLVMAHLHSANQLKAHAIGCINTNSDTVVNTQGWDQLINKYQQLITEVFKAKNSMKS